MDNKENNQLKQTNTNLTQEEALDLQINFLKTNNDMLGTIFEKLNDINIAEKNEENVDPAISLYLNSIYNQYYINELNNCKNIMNDRVQFVNDKIKELDQSKKTKEHEVNWVSQEKIDSFLEKENLDKELETLIVEKNQKNLQREEVLLKSFRDKLDMENKNDVLPEKELEKKNNKLKELKLRYEKIFENLKENKLSFTKIQNENNKLKGDNLIINENIKQKNLILEQLKKTVKNSSKLNQNKSNKINSFFKNFFKNKK